MTDKQKNTLNSIGVNLEDVLERFVDNEELYFNCIEKFKSNPYFDNFEQSFREGDVHAAFEAIQTLMGVAGNMGFTWLYGKCAEVTEILRAGSLNVSSELLFDLKEEYLRVISNVNNL